MVSRFLMLVSGVWLIASTAAAMPINPHAADGVAALWNRGESIIILRTSGEIAAIRRDWSTGEWYCDPDANAVGLPPIPIETIRDWAPDVNAVVTFDWDVWTWGGPGEGEWRLVGNFDCMGPIGAQQQSIGGLKALFR